HHPRGPHGAVGHARRAAAPHAVVRHRRHAPRPRRARKPPRRARPRRRARRRRHARAVRRRRRPRRGRPVRGHRPRAAVRRRHPALARGAVPASLRRRARPARRRGVAVSRAEAAPAAAPPRGRRTAVVPPEPRGRGVTGWTTLLGFALRRERVRIPVWTASVALLLAYVAVALDALYPTAAERQARAALVSSPAGIMLSGPQYGIEDYTLGAMIANEMALTVMVAVAIMSISLVVRHTRAEEETGRAELVRAGVVGRHAPGTAAFAAALVANAAIAVASGAVLSAAGLAPVDSFALGAAVGVTGLVFAAVATVTSQVTEHARAASGLALAVLGVAFLLRAFGDVQELHGSWVSWLSPVGWAQQIRAYVDLRWWPLALSLVLVALLLVLGAALAARRDLGAGLVPPRAGRPDAGGWLASPRALAWRRQRASVLAWGVAVGLTALACGTFVDSVGTMVADNPEIAAML